MIVEIQREKNACSTYSKRKQTIIQKSYRVSHLVYTPPVIQKESFDAAISFLKLDPQFQHCCIIKQCTVLRFMVLLVPEGNLVWYAEFSGLWDSSKESGNHKNLTPQPYRQMIKGRNSCHHRTWQELFGSMPKSKKTIQFVHVQLCKQ